MSGWVIPFLSFIIGTSLVLTVLGLWFTAIIPVIDRWSKRLFIAYFSSLLLCSAVSIVDMLFFPRPHIAWLQLTLAFLESFCLSLPLPMLTAYLIQRSNWVLSSCTSKVSLS